MNGHKKRLKDMYSRTPTEILTERLADSLLYSPHKFKGAFVAPANTAILWRT